MRENINILKQLIQRRAETKTFTHYKETKIRKDPGYLGYAIQQREISGNN